ncbi:MAG: hypothetical protein V1815_02805 [Candidatus Woesearchaeota archaeon]
MKKLFITINIVLILLLIILFSKNIKIFNITGYTIAPPLLQWQGNCDLYELTIDDNKEFTSPEIYIKTKYSEYQTINLTPKDYYYKVNCIKDNEIIESDSGSFLINSLIALELNKTILKNTGNVQLRLEFSNLTNASLDINKIISIENISGVIASQK